ncbi:MAG: hypothetical protein MPN21_16695 [Thermoanaerobaculia bacterium]|nr:hypothetical protein [Thermoanaerobaculia bacterium]
MTASRIVQLLSAALLILLLVTPASAGDRVVILDGGKSWAVEESTGLRSLPAPAGDVVLHKAAHTASGRLVAGIEQVHRQGKTAERLILWQYGEDSAERIPAPKQLHDAATYAPTPLIEDGVLSGLVWIEGFAPNKTRVLAAQRSGAGWSQPVAVSEFGPGTQIALDVARLSDGSLLAVWAAYDGEDDEIVWSRYDGTWTRPRALTANDVPDVTPTLHATKRGAIVAWSGYDGNDYRIQLADFTSADTATWSEPRLLQGRGAVSPQFQRTANDAAVLTWRQAVPRTWMAATLRGGELLWAAPAAAPTTQLEGQPLASIRDGAVQLLWPVAASENAANTKTGPTTILVPTIVQRP